MNATEEKPQQINGLQDRPSSVHDRTSVNDSGTESKIDTPLTQPGSRPVRYEVVSRWGSISDAKFDTAGAAAEYAAECFPKEEQDPDRTGKGWDIQVATQTSRKQVP